MKPDTVLLVNAWNPLPEGYEERIRPQLAGWQDPLTGRRVVLEKHAMEAAVRLMRALEKEGVGLTLAGGLRTLAEQQDIIDRYMVKYGPEYVRRFVALPGRSEHHTGLAMDFFLVKDGKAIRENLETVKETELWAKVQRRAPQFGLILRYPEGKEEITGVAYEPWHFRYVGEELAGNITKAGLALEEYLEEEKKKWEKNS